MFYLKVIINGQPTQIEINQEEMFTQCFNCGKEMEVDTEMIRNVLEDGDLYSTRVSCCGVKPTLTRIK